MKHLTTLLIFFVFTALSSCDKPTTSPPEIPTGSERAIAVYNHAYQENFDADNIADILAEAENAYILLDPWENDLQEQIAKLKVKDNQLGAYISIGTGENWRSDFTEIEPFLIDQQWGEWEGEFFVNKTTTGIVDLMKARIEILADQGFDWVEFDNMDWAFDDDLRQEYGFQVTSEEAISYYQTLCSYVHQKGMKCMAKNTVEQGDSFDGVLYESFSNEKNWWNNVGTSRFIDAGKVVIVNHYNENNCDDVYLEYMNLYNPDISFICEDRNLKKYIHYNQ